MTRQTPRQIIDEALTGTSASAIERTELEGVIANNTKFFPILGPGHVRISDIEVTKANQLGVELTLTFRIDRK